MIIARGAFYNEKKINGANGRIIFKKSNAIITINQDLKYPQQKRFVAAHELGHFELHKNLLKFFCCKESDFLKWHQNGAHEYEANVFAAELLMPRLIFKEKCGNNMFEVIKIRELADMFCTSYTSTAIRYAEHGNYPIALFYSQNNKIMWNRKSSDFQCFNLKDKNTIVPYNSVANDYFNCGYVPKVPELIQPSVWFYDRNLKPNQKAYEQCMPVKSLNGVLSFVWFE